MMVASKAVSVKASHITTPTCYQTNGSHDTTHRPGDGGGRHFLLHWNRNTQEA